MRAILNGVILAFLALTMALGTACDDEGPIVFEENEDGFRQIREYADEEEEDECSVDYAPSCECLHTNGNWVGLCSVSSKMVCKNIGRQNSNYTRCTFNGSQVYP